MPDDNGNVLSDVDPLAVNRIHLVGVAGTGMGAFAGMLKAAGYTVTGSDENVYPPMSDMLREWGIDVYTPYAPENLDRASPDLVIIGNVIRRVNPEATAVRERGIPQMSFPAAFGSLVLADRHSIVIVGTHGKTTTSALDGARARVGPARPDLPRRRRDRELRREFPVGERQVRRGRRRRVRHRVLRQGPQVPALSRPHRDADEHRVRPRGHLPRPAALRVAPSPGSAKRSPRVACWP